MSKIDLDRFNDFMVEYKKEIAKDYEDEIERLNNIIKEIDNAFKYENLHNNMELVREIKRILINEYYKGVELTENDKKQAKWLEEEFNVGVDKE